MINRKIFNELEKKKNIKTIYKLIKNIREESGYKLTKEDAAYILAGNLGIDIAKFLEKDELDRLRNAPTEIKIIETKSKAAPKTFQLKIKDIPTNIPFLEEKTIRDCDKMSETYQLFYLLENSIRSFVLIILQSEYSSDKWWDKDNVVTTDIKKEVAKRMNRERENRWHTKIGDHPIYYTDFKDLKDLIRHNWKGGFEKFFPDQHWIISRLQDLELSRNIIAHNNLLPQDEVNRIKLYFRDWRKQIKGGKCG